MTELPRGVRNNNPGNLERLNPRAGWNGALPDDQLTDPRFEQFTTATWGLRALGMTLLAYQLRHGCRTPRTLIDRWAPPIENDTTSYVAQVALALGVGPDDRVDLCNPADLQRAVVAIIRRENGQQPYPDDLISSAIALALTALDTRRPSPAASTQET